MARVAIKDTLVVRKWRGLYGCALDGFECMWRLHHKHSFERNSPEGIKAPADCKPLTSNCGELTIMVGAGVASCLAMGTGGVGIWFCSGFKYDHVQMIRNCRGTNK